MGRTAKNTLPNSGFGILIYLIASVMSKVYCGNISPSDVAVKDLLKLYLADQEMKGNYKIAEGRVRLHLMPAFGKLKASELTTDSLPKR